MRFSLFSSLRIKIILLFSMLVAAVFAVNLVVAVRILEAEKRSDLEKILTHATEDSMEEYLPPDVNEKTDISYLYDVPHNISLLQDSEADSIEFVVSKNIYVSQSKEIVGYTKTYSGLYLNCISKSAKIDAAVNRYAKNLLIGYVIYLIVILTISFFALERLIRPLGLLALKCRTYKDGDVFEIAHKKCGDEICEVSGAFASLVERLENYRKKEKELFKEAAHELKTPIAIMRARLDVYQNSDEYDKEKFIFEISADVERLVSELKGVLFFESSDFEASGEFEAARSIKNTLAKMDILIKRQSVDVLMEPANLRLNKPKKLFEKLILALMENALTYAKNGSQIVINIEEHAKTICIKNEKGGEKYLFSSKIGEKILDRISNEMGFSYIIHDENGFYEVCLNFGEKD